MTVTAPAPQTPTPRTRPRWGPGRVLAAVAAILFLLLGTALLAGGGIARLVDGPGRSDQGFIMSPAESWWSPGYAVRSESAEIHVDASVVDVPGRVLGTMTATADPTASDAVFIGVARTADVDRYLRGVAHSTVVDPAGHHRDGMMPMAEFFDGGSPAVAPSAADFWESSASGPGRQSIQWEPENGSWTLVVMNSDGTATVAADVAVGAEVPVLGTVGTFLIIGGLVVMALSGVGVWLVVRR